MKVTCDGFLRQGGAKSMVLCITIDDTEITQTIPSFTQYTRYLVTLPGDGVGEGTTSGRAPMFDARGCVAAGSSLDGDLPLSCKIVILLLVS